MIIIVSYFTGHLEWAADFEAWVRGSLGHMLFLITANRRLFITCKVKLAGIMCVSLGVRGHLLPPFEKACGFDRAELEADQVRQPPGEGKDDHSNNEGTAAQHDVKRVVSEEKGTWDGAVDLLLSHRRRPHILLISSLETEAEGVVEQGDNDEEP